MVHGGRWSLLDKSYLNSVIYKFTKKGLNLALSDVYFRLADYSNTNFEEIMNDFNLFFEHHDNLKINLGLSNRVVLWVIVMVAI